MPTPSHRTTLWITSNVLWFSSIPAHFSYLSRELKAGSFPPYGDTIAIPLFGWAMFALLLSPVLNAIWWWLSRQYPGRVSLLSRVDRSLVGNSLLAVTGLLVFLSIWELLAGAPEISIVVASWCYLTLAYRSAYLHARREIAV
jgi:hypothetical protein